MSIPGGTTQPSLSTRVKVWFDRLPFVTKVVLVTCLSIYAAGALIGFDDYSKVCLSADRVLWHGEVWRLLTAAVFHMGALHVAFNMLAFVPIGMTLERALGSVAFAHLMLLLIVLADAAFVFFSFIAAFGPARLGGEWVRQCAVGLSGVIFGLIVADNATNHANHRSIFGFFNVPAALYPWALLVFWQLIMPGASFLGHLCGVLVGQLYVWGMLNWLLLPGWAVRAIEGSRACALAYNCAGFIASSGPAANATGGAPPLPVSHTPATGGGGGAEQQRGGWLAGGWLRLPGSDPPEGGGGGGSGGGASRASGLFGLGGSHGTAAAFAGLQGRTIGASDRALGQGVPAYAANAGLSAAPVQPPPMYPVVPNIAGGAGSVPPAGGSGQPSSSGSRSAGSSAGYSAGSGGGGGGRKLDPHAAGVPGVTARSAAAAAAEARARRFSGGATTADGGSPPTRPASVPGSPPTSSNHRSGLRSARSADGGSLHRALRPSGAPFDSIGSGPDAAAGGGGEEAGPRPEALQQLVAMGFPGDVAAEALLAAGGDVAAAVALLSGGD